MSDHFQESEFACNCCGKIYYKENLPELMRRLELLRSKLGDKVMTILSGCRCPAHNKAIGGVEHSRHLTCEAADVFVPGVPSGHVFAAAKEFFAGAIYYQGRHFVHCDLRAPSERYWAVVPKATQQEA